MTVAAPKADALAEVCRHLSLDDEIGASRVLQERYPHVPAAARKRRYSVHQMLSTFLRDGFVDRYSGERLVLPGVLHLLSARLPDAFPMHPNWKMGETHMAYWELMPTLDHVVPVARGGANAPENWATTSMRRNNAKANWTLEELGWGMVPPGDLSEWDGLTGWFRAHVAERPDLLVVPGVARWHRACLARWPFL